MATIRPGAARRLIRLATSKTGQQRAANAGLRAFKIRPIVSGTIIVTNSDCAILRGSTAAPGKSRGSKAGRQTSELIISSTIKATDSARSLFAAATSLGRNGAPAAAPIRTRPALCDSLSEQALAIQIDASGTMAKLAASDAKTNWI